MEMTVDAGRRRPGTVTLVTGAWLAAALALGGSGAMAGLPLTPPVVAGVVTAAALLALSFADRARAAILERGPAPLIALHLVRFGAIASVAPGDGFLPRGFAVRAAWGEVAVALAAITLLLAAVPADTRGRRVGLAAWNVFGLVQILVVMGMATRLAIAGMPTDPFTRLPMSLLPTFLVPLFVASHVLLFVWLRRAPAGGAAAAVADPAA